VPPIEAVPEGSKSASTKKNKKRKKTKGIRPALDFTESESLPYTSPELHHHISPSRNFHFHIPSWLAENDGDLAVKVSNFPIIRVATSARVAGLPTETAGPSFIPTGESEFSERQQSIFPWAVRNVVLKPNSGLPRELHELRCSLRPRLDESEKLLRHYDASTGLRRGRHSPFRICPNLRYISRRRGSQCPRRDRCSHAHGVSVGQVVPLGSNPYRRFQTQTVPSRGIPAGNRPWSVWVCQS
ncbi:hypothetical protein C8F04DRAFT_1404643, partial [Mycena alexandri]